MIAATGLGSPGRNVVLGEGFAGSGGTVPGLLGPNGSGKTTLLRILATLLRPTTGTLSIGGIDALRDPGAVRTLIGMVGHGSYVYPDLTALENLRFWTVMGGSDATHDRLVAALQQVDLEATAHDRVRTFSAGMKRRLALARVVLGRARLLLLRRAVHGSTSGVGSG
jgi:ABC-type multidrug transport system ATPase subunit